MQGLPDERVVGIGLRAGFRGDARAQVLRKVKRDRRKALGRREQLPLRLLDRQILRRMRDSGHRRSGDWNPQRGVETRHQNM